MKTRLLLVGGLLAFSVALPSQAAGRRAEKPSLQVSSMPDPFFPEALARAGVLGGEAELMVTIGADGRASDSMVVSYTHRELADLSLDVLKDTYFVPVVRNGVATSVRTRLTFAYEAHGLIVSQTVGEHLHNRLERLLSTGRVTQLKKMGELDRAPKATRVVNPQYPATAAEQGAGTRLTIDFFIDEKGRVRMPVLDRGEHSPLAEAAVAALLEWQFDPPTQRGRPVIVNAKQEFVFAPAREG